MCSFTGTHLASDIIKSDNFLGHRIYRKFHNTKHPERNIFHLITIISSQIHKPSFLKLTYRLNFTLIPQFLLECSISLHSCQLSRILGETHAFWGGIASEKCIFVREDPYKIKRYDWKLKISRILTFKSWQLCIQQYY